MKRLLLLVTMMMYFSAAPTLARSIVPLLIGGQPLDQNNFPEIAYIRSGNAHCSATIVGTQVILTAAHCVTERGSLGPVYITRDIEFIYKKSPYIAKCEQSPLYRDDKEIHDMALCKITSKLVIKAASISRVGPRIGEEVLLTGYGCTNTEGEGGSDGILRAGLAKVFHLPEGTNHWFYTRGATALCYGDSGGPALLNSISKSHLIVGVNSRGNIQDLSLFTALYTKTSLAFFDDYVKRNSVEICGINKDC